MCTNTGLANGALSNIFNHLCAVARNFINGCRIDCTNRYGTFSTQNQAAYQRTVPVYHYKKRVLSYERTVLFSKNGGVPYRTVSPSLRKPHHKLIPKLCHTSLNTINYSLGVGLVTPAEKTCRKEMP